MIVLKPAAVLIGSEVVSDRAIMIEDGAIAAVLPGGDLPKDMPVHESIELPGQLVMPGLVNAHQHGRGLTALQLGFRDEPLEAWLVRKRLRAPMDPYAMTLLAAIRMLASGVTSTIQANAAYGTGDYEAEIADEVRAYTTAGLRVMIGIGAMDRADLVYPAEAQPAFIRGLPDHLRAMVDRPRFELYAGNGAATVSFLAHCRAAHRHPLISFCYSPAGPQWASDALLQTLAEDAARHGLPIHMHGLESHAQAVALREAYPDGLLAHLSKLGVVSNRLSIAHAVWLTQDDIAIAREAGLVLVRNPGSNLRLHAGIAPLAHYLAHGVTVAIGSDNTTLTDDEDLFSELRLAARLAQSPHWDGPPAPAAAQLLAMATQNGAAAMGLHEKLGRIEPGCVADLIALSLDRVRGAYWDDDRPLIEAVLARASRHDVTLTMVNGEVVYRDGRFRDLSPERIAAEVAENARRTRHPPGVDAAAVAELVDHVSAFYRRRHERLTREPWAPVAETQGWS